MNNAPIVLPQPLQDSLEALAQQQNRPVQDIVHDAITLYIATLHRLQSRAMTMHSQHPHPQPLSQEGEGSRKSPPRRTPCATASFPPPAAFAIGFNES